MPRRPAAADQFGPLLRRLMDRAGLDAEALAERSGYERSGIFRLLNGTRTPRLDTAERLCAACGAHLCDLYDPAVEPMVAPGRWPREPGEK